MALSFASSIFAVKRGQSPSKRRSFVFISAWQTDAVERNLDQLPVKDRHEYISVTIHPHEIVTVRIKTANNGAASTER